MKRFSKLMAFMKARGYKNDDLAELLHVSNAAVSQRFSGRTQWRLNEIYKIVKLLGINVKKISEYFPE